MSGYAIIAVCPEHGRLTWREFEANVVGEGGREYRDMATYLIVTCKYCGESCEVTLVRTNAFLL